MSRTFFFLIKRMTRKHLSHIRVQTCSYNKTKSIKKID